MTTPDLIEKVARAMWNASARQLGDYSWKYLSRFEKDDLCVDARAALEAMLREMLVDASMAPSGLEYDFIKAFAKSHAISLEDTHDRE